MMDQYQYPNTCLEMQSNHTSTTVHAPSARRCARGSESGRDRAWDWCCDASSCTACTSPCCEPLATRRDINGWNRREHQLVNVAQAYEDNIIDVSVENICSFPLFKVLSGTGNSVSFIGRLKFFTSDEVDLFVPPCVKYGNSTTDNRTLTVYCMMTSTNLTAA